MRLGCDPVHRHLLLADVQVLQGWRTMASWAAMLRSGAVDAALVSVAALQCGEEGQESGCSGASPPVSATARGDRAARACDAPLTGPGEAAGVAGTRQPIALDDCGVTALALGASPLVLLLARDQQRAQPPGMVSPVEGGWTVLLPPQEQQPLLWQQLRALDLLPVRVCQASDDRGLREELAQSQSLLPAPFSLLEDRRWRGAFAAVPPPEPLIEWLWLLVLEERQHEAALLQVVTDWRQQQEREIRG